MPVLPNKTFYKYSPVKVQLDEAYAWGLSTVRLYFDQAVEDDDTLRAGTSYAFTGGTSPLIALEAARVSGHTDRVDVTVLGQMEAGVAYTVTVSAIHALGMHWSIPDPTAYSYPFVGAGKQVYVSTTGNDVTGTGTQALPYKTVAKGLTQSTASGTLWLENGTYTETGVLNINCNNLTIQAINRREANITSLVCGGDTVIKATAKYVDSVRLQSLVINGAADGTGQSIVRFPGLGGLAEIDDCIVRNNPQPFGTTIGIYIPVTKVRITNSEIYGITGSIGVLITTTTFAELQNVIVHDIIASILDIDATGIRCIQNGNAVINILGCEVYNITAQATGYAQGIDCQWTNGTGRIESCYVHDIVSPESIAQAFVLTGTPARRVTLKDCRIENIDSRRQPTLVTGVTIIDVSDSTLAGAATLSYAAGALRYAAPGDALGIAVAVPANGRYILTSGAPGSTKMAVHVIAASLPGAPAVDTIVFTSPFGVYTDIHTNPGGLWLSGVSVKDIYGYGSFTLGFYIQETVGAAHPHILVDYCTANNTRRGYRFEANPNVQMQRSISHHNIAGAAFNRGINVYNCVFDWSWFGVQYFTSPGCGTLTIRNTQITRTADRDLLNLDLTQTAAIFATGDNGVIDIDYSNIYDYATRSSVGATTLTEGAHMLGDVLPYFKDWDNGDYHLFALSPGVNAGEDLGILYFGEAPDIGCYETTLTTDDLINTPQEFIDKCLDPGFWETDYSTGVVPGIVRAVQVALFGELRADTDQVKANYWFNTTNDLTSWSSLFPVFARELIFEQFLDRVRDLWFSRAEANTVSGIQRVATAYTGQPCFICRYDDYPDAWVVGESYIGFNNYVSGAYKTASGQIIEVYGNDEISDDVEAELRGQLLEVAGNAPVWIQFEDDRQPSNTLLIKDGFNSFYSATLSQRHPTAAVEMPVNMRFTFDGQIEIINPKVEAVFRTYPIDTSTLTGNTFIFGLADRLYMDNIVREAYYRVGPSTVEAAMGSWLPVIHGQEITITAPNTFIQFRIWVRNTQMSVDSDTNPHIVIHDYSITGAGSSQFDYLLAGNRMRWRAPKDRTYGDWVTMVADGAIYRLWSRNNTDWVDVITPAVPGLPGANFNRSILMHEINKNSYKFSSIMLREVWS